MLDLGSIYIGLSDSRVEIVTSSVIKVNKRGERSVGYAVAHGANGPMHMHGNTHLLGLSIRPSIAKRP